MEQWEIDNNPFHSYHRWPECEIETHPQEGLSTDAWYHIQYVARQMGIAANEVKIGFQKHFDQYRHVVVDDLNNPIWVMPGQAHQKDTPDHTTWSYSPLVGFTSSEEDAKQTFIERYGGPLKGFVPYRKKNKKKEKLERKLKHMQEKEALRKKHERELQQLEAYEELKRFDKKSRRLSG